MTERTPNIELNDVECLHENLYNRNKFKNFTKTSTIMINESLVLNFHKIYSLRR